MDALDHAHRLRLLLGDTLRAQRHLARERHDTIMDDAIRGVLERLAREEFVVAITGQFSRGKTTLLNALLGADYLPTGALPTTTVLTRVRYGSTARAEYRRRGSDVNLPVDLTDIPQLIARRSVQRTEQQVAAVDIWLPAPLLRQGVTFVDTPGVGSGDAATSATTFDFLPEADAVLFVTSADSALNDADRQMLARLPAAASVFGVVNKRDLVTAADATAVTAAVADAVRDAAPDAPTGVFTVSALQGRRASSLLSPDSDDGGIRDMTQDLSAFLGGRQAQVALARVHRQALDLARRQSALLTLADRHSAMTADARAMLRAALEDATAQAAAVRQSTLAQIHDDAVEKLADLHTHASARWQHDAAAMMENPDTDVNTWLTALSGQVTEAVVAAAAPHLPTLARACASPLITALTQTGGDAAAEASAAVASWTVTALPPVATPRGDALPSPDVPGRHPLRDRHATARREQAAAVFVADVVHRLDVAVAGWHAAVARRAEHVAGDQSERLGAYLSEAPTMSQREAWARVDADLDTAAELLTAFPQEVDDTQPTTEVAVDAHDRPPRRCPVCLAARQALIDDLTQRQFALATREAEQDALARHGGMCPLHTWSYVQTTSPLGVAAGYARRSQVVADDLRRSLERTSSTQSPPETCPVCVTVAEAEHREIRRLCDDAGRVVAEDPVLVLCMRHLRAARALGMDPATADTLSRRLADTLARDSEDMREYALKREALARDRLTEEERRAAQEALLLLVGDPALARPLSDPDTDEIGYRP